MLPKAIETKYKHYRFRSRTEARWAVFFDAMQLNWQYEVEGYELPGGWYLPDFYFPDLEMHAEVKGRNFTETESSLTYSLSQCTGEVVVELDGPPDFRIYDAWYCEYEPCGCDPWNCECETDDVSVCKCNVQFGVTLPDMKDDHFTITHSVFISRFYGVSDAFNKYSRLCKDAIAAARSARFEHGESPR